MWDDDEPDYDPDYDPEEERRRLEATPIFQKAEEIRDLTQRIVETMDKNDPESEIQSSLMLEDSMIIPAKIAGAEAVDDYILKMENAEALSSLGRRLLTRAASLKYLELVAPACLQVLLDEVEAVRRLVRTWVAAFQFDTTKAGDGWGLFVDDE